MYWLCEMYSFLNNISKLWEKQTFLVVFRNVDFKQILQEILMEFEVKEYWES